MRSMHALVFALSVAIVACTPGTPGSPETKAPKTVASASNVYRFRIGSLEAVAVKDGHIAVLNDGTMIGLGQPTEAVAALLAKAGHPSNPIELSIQPLAVKDGARIFLFDTGAADASFAKAGRLPTSLREAGIAPSDVTDIFITHGHPDHAGGLLAKDGTLAFPKARIHLAKPEWTAMQGDTKQARLVAVVAPHVDAFDPGSSIFPSVTAVEVRGHTPGHTAYRIASGTEQLLVIGDSAHHSIVSVERPDWPIQFDQGGDPSAALASRRALLERAAKEHLRLYAVHFPFPGLGRVEPRGDNFIWVPEAPEVGPR